MNDEEAPTLPPTQWVRKRLPEQDEGSSKVSAESSATASPQPPQSALGTKRMPEAASPSRAMLLMVGVAALLLVSVFSGVLTLGALLILR